MHLPVPYVHQDGPECAINDVLIFVTRMLEELTWAPLSKRRENACLILFYKIINNLAMVPHSCLEKADGRTWKKHSMKFRHIGYNVDSYGQSFFPKSIIY